MKKVMMLFCALFALGGCHGGNSRSGVSTIDNSTVDSLDVVRFMGRWYEIARYEHRFERGMTHVSATYTLRPDGKIEVLNEGVKDGKAKSVKGRARQPDPADPGKLEVSFFLWFYSDYYILHLDPDYRYVIVGSSTDKYLWIMSRERTLPVDVLDGLLSVLQERGYDTERLLFVDQN